MKTKAPPMPGRIENNTILQSVGKPIGASADSENDISFDRVVSKFGSN